MFTLFVTLSALVLLGVIFSTSRSTSSGEAKRVREEKRRQDEARFWLRRDIAQVLYERDINSPSRRISAGL